MKYGLIGEKLGHSFSLPIHSAIGLYEYELCALTESEFSDFMEKREFCGINITIPYKKKVMAYLDEISPDALLCGGVNTVVNRNGKLFGTNTDLCGMEEMLNKENISLSGKHVLILGTGGTSGTALALCRKKGAASALRVSRSEKEGAISYEEAKQRKETQIIINTTPCGMFPQVEGCPIDLDFFPDLQGVADVIYNPLRTNLILEAQERGVPCASGLLMLVAQGVLSAQIFTGNQTLFQRCDEIYRALKRQKENLVLIGMPGSGKSTLGKRLAQEFGLGFLDTDEKIARKAGETIPAIFAREGEEGFRKRESESIASLRSSTGLVIATGGGAVLREENVRNLKRCGTLIYLDAPLESLLPTPDRPLSSDAASLKKRYEERKGIYENAADIQICVSRNVEENIAAIKKELL